MRTSASPPPSSAPRPAEAWAWLDGGGAGRFTAGGAFVRSSLPSADRIAFYVNDFALSEEEPWRIPEVDSVAETIEAHPPSIAWEAPSPADFRTVFDELMEAVRGREILKAVPVAVAK